MTAEDVIKAIDQRKFDVVPLRTVYGTYFYIVCKKCGKTVYSFHECCGSKEETIAATLTQLHITRGCKP